MIIFSSSNIKKIENNLNLRVNTILKKEHQQQ
jgi:hypothetical protein